MSQPLDPEYIRDQSFQSCRVKKIDYRTKRFYKLAYKLAKKKVSDAEARITLLSLSNDDLAERSLLAIGLIKSFVKSWETEENLVEFVNEKYLFSFKAFLEDHPS